MGQSHKELRSGVPKSSEYLFGDDLNQRIHAITKISKTIKTNTSPNANIDSSKCNKRTFPKANYNSNYQLNTLQKNTNPSRATSTAPLESKTKEGHTTTATTNAVIIFSAEQVSKFKVVNIRKCYPEWERITSDSKILEIVRNGLSINFEYIPHKYSPHQHKRAHDEASVTDNEIKRILLKRVIIPTTIEKQDSFSKTRLNPLQG